MVTLYLRSKPAGFAPGRLPFAGELCDQPACMIASFDALAGAEAALREAFPQAFDSKAD